MTPASNTVLSLILIALGFLGVSLSFLVPDKRKSMISLGLAAAIVAAGLIQWISEPIKRYQLERQFRNIQRQNVDFEALRQKMKESVKSAPVTAPKKP